MRSLIQERKISGTVPCRGDSRIPFLDPLNFNPRFGDKQEEKASRVIVAKRSGSQIKSSATRKFARLYTENRPFMTVSCPIKLFRLTGFIGCCMLQLSKPPEGATATYLSPTWASLIKKFRKFWGLGEVRPNAAKKRKFGQVVEG